MRLLKPLYNRSNTTVIKSVKLRISLSEDFLRHRPEAWRKRWAEALCATKLGQADSIMTAGVESSVKQFDPEVATRRIGDDIEHLYASALNDEYRIPFKEIAGLVWPEGLKRDGTPRVRRRTIGQLFRRR